MTTLTFTIPKPLWLSANRQIPNHGFRRSIVGRLHALVTEVLTDERPQPIAGPVHADWTIRYPKGVRRDKGDPSNSLPTTKACLDACVTYGLLEDDGPMHVTAETFRRGPNLDEPGVHEVRLRLTADPDQERP